MDDWRILMDLRDRLDTTVAELVALERLVYAHTEALAHLTAAVDGLRQAFQLLHSRM